MPQVQLQRQEQLLERMLSRLIARTNLSDVTDTSAFKHIFAAVARELDEAYYQMTRLTDLWNIDRASGDDLDERAKDIQPGTLTRIQSRSSVGTVIFSRSTTSGNVVIPVGTIVKTEDGIEFQTTAQSEILTGNNDSLSTPIASVSPGSEGNVSAGTIVKFGSKIPGVDSVTNDSATINGIDKETDDSFRERIKDFVSSLSRCTVQAMEFASIGLEDTDTGKQVIYSHIFEDPIDRGNVILYIDDGAGTAKETVEIAPQAVAISSISAPVATIQTLVVGVETFHAVHEGKSVTVASATAGNNGTFTIIDVVDSFTITYVNAGGVIQGALGNVTVADEVVIASAVGGEEFLYLDQFPIDLDVGTTLISSIRNTPNPALTYGTDYVINPASGRIFFDPPLLVGETITARYTFFIGLIPVVQQVIDGDLNDRANYPGYRPAGVLVRVLSPTVVSFNVEANLVLKDGANRSVAVAAAEQAVLEYVNSRGISGDVIKNELIEQIMSASNAVDINLISPTTNVTVNDDEIPRITISNIDIN